MGKPGTLMDPAATELASTRGFSVEERDAILTLISESPNQSDAVDHAYSTVLQEMGPRDFEWPEFDRWYRLFARHGLFPPLWEGLEHRPCRDAALLIQQAYRQRKLYLLLDWLHGLTTTRAEMRAALARYALRGVGAEIARQRAEITCPVCDGLNFENVGRACWQLPPFHPGCRCLILATLRRCGADRAWGMSVTSYRAARP